MIESTATSKAVYKATIELKEVLKEKKYDLGAFEVIAVDYDERNDLFLVSKEWDVEQKYSSESKKFTLSVKSKGEVYIFRTTGELHQKMNSYQQSSCSFKKEIPDNLKSILFGKIYNMDGQLRRKIVNKLKNNFHE